MNPKNFLFTYKWNIHFIYNTLNLDNEIIQVKSFDVKPHSVKDEHPNLIEKYLPRPIPLRIKLYFSRSNIEFGLYTFFNTENIIKFFSRFYGAHPETKADFIIRIDAEARKYELALFRQGLREPVVIPESAYQLIVFKNKFEDYRSKNYNQPRGAWIW